MHRAIVNSQASRWNTRFSRLLIIAALTLSAVQEAQSMPSRELKQLPASLELDLVEKKYDEQEESTLYAEETPPIITNVPKNRIKRLASVISNSTTTETPLDIAGINSQKDSHQAKITRRDSEPNEDGLCRSEIVTIYPTSARNQNNERMYIVQDEANGITQSLRVEICLQGVEGSPCQIIEGSISGYKTSCKQKYITRTLTASYENGTTAMASFLVPASCCCYIKFVGI